MPNLFSAKVDPIGGKFIASAGPWGKGRPSKSEDGALKNLEQHLRKHCEVHSAGRGNQSEVIVQGESTADCVRELCEWLSKQSIRTDVHQTFDEEMNTQPCSIEHDDEVVVVIVKVLASHSQVHELIERQITSLASTGQ